ncbi:hypothetical protein AB0K21_21575 [Streptosporangium sp. NPDC049248]|uniref:hypothetical protein n=1 Tax=Streptosporangium sp. NPDC049248 TaxID=3155651 RepID=UPI003433B8F5
MIDLPKRYVLAGTSWGEHDHTIRTQRLAVVNAPRPLIGNPTWYGEFLHGRHYAAGVLDELIEQWRADDAILLAEITPQAIMRKVTKHLTDNGYTLHQLAKSYDGAAGDLAAELGLPWDDAWLTVPFQPAPAGYKAFTGVAQCEHGVHAQAWFLQVIRPGNPLPEDLEMGIIGQDDPTPWLKVKARAAAIEGRADQYQLSYIHRDLCRTADDPAGI